MKHAHTYSIKLAAPMTECDATFLQGMANRMSISYYKYGPIAEGYPHKVDAVASAKQRIEAYFDTGNIEYLIDASNFLMIEYMHPSIEGAHFQPTDSDGSTGRITNAGSTTREGNASIELSASQSKH